MLVVYEPPAVFGHSPVAVLSRIRLQFNPSQLALGKQASWIRKGTSSALEASRPQYNGPGPRAMSVEVFLDSSQGNVEKDVETLLSCCSPTKESIRAKRPVAPLVRLEWGTTRTTSFLALVTHVQATYTLFASDASPKRATCTVNLEETGGVVPRQNPTSGGDAALCEHRLVQGESLALVSWQAYQDPTLWRAVARTNGVDDPLTVPPGRVLIVPAVENAGADR
ncbi:peptidase M23 [Streptomyces sp. NPDC057743]|uniref:CIS tube protein n=1 Tax=Streptomyces sp. NPDC057743 TaxID=3346236 RepID=UPI0036AA44C4